MGRLVLIVVNTMVSVRYSLIDLFHQARQAGTLRRFLLVDNQLLLTL